MSLDDLKRQRANLDKQISEAETAEEEQRRLLIVLSSYARIVCTNCHGTTQVFTGGADVLTDPPDVDTCESCQGNGYINAEVWQGKRYYQLEFDERDKW